MKKIVIINGSPHKSGKTMTLVGDILKTSVNNEFETKSYDLSSMQIKGCQGCYSCKKTGKCIVKDDMHLIYQDIENADGIIFATPVFIWQMTAQMKLVIDRLYAFMKQDYTSYLAPNKKFLFVVTFGGGNMDQYRSYFDMTCKSLKFIGFGEYKYVIAGGLKESQELYEGSNILIDTSEISTWLLS